MIANGVTSSTNLCKDFWVMPHVLSNTEKRGFSIVAAQAFKYPRGAFWYGSVVKGEVNRLGLIGYAPRKVIKELLDKLGRTNQIHVR